jgi:CDP-diacylglycerol--serine O-phosphatidyltransferase
LNWHQGIGTVKKIAILPTLLTLGNAVCGFAAIAYGSKIGQEGTTAALDNFYFAIGGWLIIAAMVFDALDGYVARLSRTASKFGGELDSLCDAISFGAAPAFLLLRMGPGWDRPFLHQMLAAIATLYMACAILRLARFNVENSPDPAYHKRFKGLPSPAAAGCLASLAILRGELADKWAAFDPHMVKAVVEVWAILGALVVALLMVSMVPYPHMTKQFIRGRRHFNHLIQVLLAVFCIVLLQELLLVVVFWGYTLFFLARYAWVRSHQGESLAAPTLGDGLPH